MTIIKCSKEQCTHCTDGECTCNLVFIDGYGECEMYEKDERDP